MSCTLGVLVIVSAMLLIPCKAVPFEHSSRHLEKRAIYQLTEGEKTEFLEVHNDYRRNAGASNMREMIWDDGLAQHAHDWIQTCVWAHPDQLNGEGQNLYCSYNYLGADVQRPTGNVSTTAWYNEVKDYHYDDNTCNPGKVCGHYTQVVWANTYKVGCAMHKCDSIVIQGSEWTGWIVGCNYSPGGNIIGNKPYKEGDACSSCKDGMRCQNSMCSDCTAGEPGCECEVECLNNGTPNKECKCDCPDGYYGDTCAEECKDKDERCGANPGWPPFWCNDPDRWFVDEGCPLMCELCVPECKVECSNNGIPNADCKCDCPVGFYGDTCAEKCEDKDAFCGASPGWPPYWCNDPQYWYVDIECPLMCGLCVPECNVECSNNGIPNDECKCDCPDGFYGDTCAETCEDKNAFCGASPGWPPFWCNDPQYWYVDIECPLMCGLCVEAPSF